MSIALYSNPPESGRVIGKTLKSHPIFRGPSLYLQSIQKLSDVGVNILVTQVSVVLNVIDSYACKELLNIYRTPEKLIVMIAQTYIYIRLLNANYFATVVNRDEARTAYLGYPKPASNSSSSALSFALC